MAVSGDSLPPARDLSESLAAHVASRPDAAAFAAIDGSGALVVQRDWRGIGADVAAVAASLARAMAPGERVLVPQGPPLAFAAALLGCLAAGMVAVPVPHPGQKRRRDGIDAIAADCAPAGMLVPAEEAAGFAPVAGVPILPIEPPVGDVPLPPAGFPADQLALLQYTSGSTGLPKGVMLSRGNLAANARAIAGALAVRPTSRFLTWLPLFHDMGLVTGLFVPVLCGVPSLFLSAQSVSRDPLLWLEMISRHRVSHSGGPNFILAACAERADADRLARLDLACWQSAYLGAEPIFAETLQSFADEMAIAGFDPAAFQPCYGLAETTLMASAAGAGRGATARVFGRDALLQGIARPPRDGEAVRRLIGCGAAPAGARIVIRDAEGRPLEEGMLGEIQLSGPSLGAGYWGKPAASAETFVTDMEGSVWLRTGDIGFLEGGDLFVAGRIKDRLILRGRTQHPHDIERAASLAHPDLMLDEAIAFPVEAVAREGYAVVCAVRREAVRRIDAATIILAIRRACVRAAQADPDAVALVGPTALPRTTSGKRKRRACAEAFASGALAPLHVWRRSETPAAAWDAPLPARADAAALAAWITGWVAHHLGLGTAAIDADLPFEELGLDSIGSVELVVALEQALERELAETLVWECQTVAGLATALASPTPPLQARPAMPAASDLLHRLRAELSGTMS